MPIEAIHLLRRLEPVVRPGAALAAQRGSGAFDSALTLMSGQAPNGRRPLVVSAGASIADTLEGDDLERLAAAADAAEAAGARRAAMILGGRVFIVEVPDRLLQTELLEDGTASHYQLDAALLVPGIDSPAFRTARPRGIGPPAAVLAPAVARQLLAVHETIAGFPPPAPAA